VFGDFAHWAVILISIMNRIKVDSQISKVVLYCNVHHLDFRNLIPI